MHTFFLSQDFVIVGHTADQTEVNNAKHRQGSLAMNIIDSDRLRLAIEHEYEVKLAKLQPETCSPKNNLLVGIYRKK